MRVSIQMDEKGRVMAVQSFPCEGEIYELPDDANPSDYVLKDGTLVLDPLVIEPSASEQIATLKRKLAETDYAVIKIAEGAATAEDYADLIAQRQAWRAEINALEEGQK